MPALPPTASIVTFADALRDQDPLNALYMAAIEVVFDEADPGEHLNRLSPEARKVYLLYSLDGEIHNGGFEQLFVNSLGDHWSELQKILSEFDAVRSHQLLNKALRWFPDSRPSEDRGVRLEQLESMEDQPGFQKALHELSVEFWECEDAISDKLLAFIAARPDARLRHA
jgi:Domain of unknown function (DUF4375)